MREVSGQPSPQFAAREGRAIELQEPGKARHEMDGDRGGGEGECDEWQSDFHEREW